MTRIYLVRHAEAEGNLYRLVQGHFDGVITKRGYAQIAALRRRFAGEHVDAVYSSDLFRARTTARAISEPRGLEIQLRRELREMHLGWWEGRTWQEVGAKEPQQLHNFHLDLSQLQIEGGESAAAVRERIMAELLRIGAENEGKTVAVISHGAAVRILLGTLRGMELHEIDQSVLGDNTAVSLLEYENGTLREIYGNDNSHLTEAGLTRFLPRSGKTVKRFEDGIAYRPMDEAAAESLRAQQLPIPQGGECLALWHEGAAAGVLQMLGIENGVGQVGCYYLAPQLQGKNHGIKPLGQAVQYYRARGIDRLRLVQVEEPYRAFFEQYGLELQNDGSMELYFGYEDRAL